MDIVSKMVGGVVGLTVGGILVGQVLIPTIQGITFTGNNATMYTTMFGVVCLMGIVALVVYAANLIKSKN